MTGFSKAVVAQIIDRDGASCVMCGSNVNLDARGADWSIHHRRPRGMGGSRSAEVSCPANGLVLCGSGTTGCHGRVEASRSWAMTHGFLVPQWRDPELVPVVHWLLGLAFPTEDGWAPIPQGPEGLLAVADRALALATERGLARADEGFTHITEALHETTHAWIAGLVA